MAVSDETEIWRGLEYKRGRGNRWTYIYGGKTVRAITRRCTVCAKPFPVRPGQARGPEHRSCSPEHDAKAADEYRRATASFRAWMDEQRRRNAHAERRLADEAAQQALRAAKEAGKHESVVDPDLLVSRIQGRTFVCDSCGGLWKVANAREERVKLIVDVLAVTASDWRRILTALASPQLLLRPAWLQQSMGWTYERSVAFLEKATRLGILSSQGKAVGLPKPQAPPSSPDQLLCVSCYRRRQSQLDGGERTSLRDPISAQLRFRVLQRDAFRCQYCGRAARDGATLHLDHVVPVAAGGPTTEGNLVTACEVCNLGKSTSTVI